MKLPSKYKVFIFFDINKNIRYYVKDIWKTIKL